MTEAPQVLPDDVYNRELVGRVHPGMRLGLDARRWLGDSPAPGQGERDHHHAARRRRHFTPLVLTASDSSGQATGERSWSVTVASRLSGTWTIQSHPSGTFSDG